MVEIDCAGEKLWLRSEKSIFWAAARTLIVADLHLGKPAAFRKAGIGVPETTTLEDLRRLETTLNTTHAERLIILGDLLHAPEGMQDVMIDTVAQWRADHAGLQIILVPGNHDRRAGPPPESWNMQSVEQRWACGPFLFTHEPMEHPEAYVMAGHLHPAFTLRERFGSGLRAACFWFGKTCAVLPAFGSFTGMSNIDPQRDDRIYAIGPHEVVQIR
jgi:DNA ligase-associated metallophosphoesterase